MQSVGIVIAEEEIKRYYDNKDKTSNQRKIFIKKTNMRYYRNKTTDMYPLRKSLDPMLNQKTEQKRWKKISQ